MFILAVNLTETKSRKQQHVSIVPETVWQIFPLQLVYSPEKIFGASHRDLVSVEDIFCLVCLREKSA